ncbi:MAG: ABC transporter permease, partial [Spirochaetales bacterium]|nr:ABC transporter permease [Spirochaetales bacterium]
MVRRSFSFFYLSGIFLFLYAPIAVLVVFSFNSARSTSTWGGFSLNWYRALFQDRQIMTALYYTLLIAFLSSVISAVAGTAAAVGIHRMRAAARRCVIALNNVPVLNPDIVTGVSLMVLFTAFRLRLGFWTLLLSHI